MEKADLMKGTSECHDPVQEFEMGGILKEGIQGK